MTKPTLVSIIIVNYKEYRYLRQCLDSVCKSSYPYIEIIVVDNESDRITLKKLEDEFKQVNFFPLEENLNYAEGNNYGITKSKGEFIVILNNDTVVGRNWIEPLLKEALDNSQAFYQPIILSLGKPGEILSLGCTINPVGIAYPISAGKSVSEDLIPKEKTEVFYCAGACIFTSRRVLNELGGFDSNYWTYYEDVSLGWRGRLRGYPSFIVPNSTIYHEWGGTYGRQLSPKKLYLLERGRLSSILRNFSVRSIISLSLVLYFFEVALLFYLVPKHMVLVKIQASIDVIRNLKFIIAERKKIQKARMKTDKYISLCMSASIEHPLIGIPHTAQMLLIFISKMLIRIL